MFFRFFYILVLLFSGYTQSFVLKKNQKKQTK